MGGKGSCLGLTALGSATVCLEPDPDLGLSRLLCSLVALLKTVLVCHSDCHALQQQLSALPGSCSCCVDQLQLAVPWNASSQKEWGSLTTALVGHALGQLLVALLWSCWHPGHLQTAEDATAWGLLVAALPEALLGQLHAALNIFALLQTASRHFQLYFLSPDSHHDFLWPNPCLGCFSQTSADGA